MSTPVPKRPVLLLDFVKSLVLGDDHYKASRPLPKELRDALVAERDALEAANNKVLAAKGTYSEATQARKAIVKRSHAAARKARNVVYGLHGRTDKALVEYGLSTPVEHRASKETPKPDPTPPPKP